MQVRLNVPKLCTSEEALVKSTIENKQMCFFFCSQYHWSNSYGGCYIQIRAISIIRSEISVQVVCWQDTWTNCVFLPYLSSGHLHDNASHTPDIPWLAWVMFENYFWSHVGWGKGGRKRGGIYAVFLHWYQWGTSSERYHCAGGIVISCASVTERWKVQWNPAWWTPLNSGHPQYN